VSLNHFYSPLEAPLGGSAQAAKANATPIKVPGEIDIFSLSVVKLESPEDAESENLLAKIDQVVDQPNSSFKFSREEYEQQSGFQESKVRYNKDLNQPRYTALRAYFDAGKSPRVAESTAYLEHIEDLMPLFDSLCELHLHRNRVASRFKSVRKHQRAWDNMANDIMRGQNTTDLPKEEKPPRQNTILCLGRSFQSRVLKHHHNVPHHRLVHVFCRRRGSHEPVLLGFVTREAGSSQYCCMCYSQLGPTDYNRMRACTNVNCPISIDRINRDHSSSIILMRFGVWDANSLPRPHPFGDGGGGGVGEVDDQLGGEEIEEMEV